MRRALIIATENYVDHEFSPLPGTVADAEGLQRVLGDPDIGAFDVKVLLNADVSAARFAVHRFFADASPRDVLVLHISAHGAQDASGQLYFVSKDSRHDELPPSALAAGYVNERIRNSAARRIVVLLDCCHGGAFTRGDGRRGPLPADFDGMSRSRGYVVITATTATQPAFERPDDTTEHLTPSGLFTRAIVRGLATGDADLDGDGYIDTHELYKYVRPSVLQYADGRQSPTFSAYNVEGSLRLAQSVRGKRPDFDGADADRPWWRVAAGHLAAAGASTLRLALTVLWWLRRVFYPPEPRGPAPRRLVLTLLVLVALLSTSGLLGSSRVAVGECPTPTTVRVATSAAGLPAYRTVAEAFEQWVAVNTQGCRSADIHLYPAAADRVVAGLRNRWTEGDQPDEHYLRDVGPHPDVWLPEASSDVPPPSELAGLPTEVLAVAETPIVLGVPQQSVNDGDEQQRRANRSWAQLFDAANRPGAAGWGGTVRGDPAASVVARIATAKLYRDGTTAPAQARNGVEKWIEQALDAAGYPIGGEAELLCRQREIHRASPAAGTAAVILTEQALVRYNSGLPSGGTCLQSGTPARQDRLVAFYPSDTPVLRQVAVLVDWRENSVQSGPGHAYARSFTNWLRDIDGRNALLRAGLRPLGHLIQAPVDESGGALRDWPFSRATRGEPDAKTRSRVAAVYGQARRSGRFLVALDASGSMNTVTADPSQTRFEVSLAAITAAAGRLGGRDEFGLLTFGGNGAGSTRDVLPVARRTADETVKASRQAQRIIPTGGTPLYEAIRQGSRRLRADPAPDRLRTLVVLTDGKDTSGQPRPSPADTAGVRVFVIAVGDVTCGEAALQQLAADTSGRCFHTDLNSVSDVLGRMFNVIWDTKDG